MIQDIINYKNMLLNLNSLIEQSPFKKGYIIEKTGISAPTFYRKLKNHSFTPDEAMNIAKIISPEETYLYELKQSLNRAEEDIKEGRLFTRDEVIKEVNLLLKK